jgi:O-antigen ligase
MFSSKELWIFSALILWLFINDSKRRRGISSALWIPLVWLSIIGSRFVSIWLGIRSASAESEGSPLDATIFLLLIIAGVIVLFRRQLDWNGVIRNNKWVTAYFLYVGISVLWADDPSIASKRWIKDFGNIIMVLVILTEHQPTEAIKAVLSRFVYLVVPLSVLFMKYLPEVGVTRDHWTGQPIYNGVGADKNILGMDLFICMVFLFWSFLELRSSKQSRAQRWKETGIHIILISMSLWLLYKAHCSTALACTILGLFLVLALRRPAIRAQGKQLAIYCLTAALVAVWLNAAFNLGDLVVASLGRDMSFHGRTDIWKAVLGENTNPLFGAGYDSFWMPGRAERVSAAAGLDNDVINEAHNGYLEAYLNGGLVGLAMLLLMMANAFSRISEEVKQGSGYGPIRFVFFLSTAVYAMTEAVFSRLGPVWLIFLFAAMNYPRVRKAGCQKWPEPSGVNLIQPTRGRVDAQSGVFM